MSKYRKFFCFWLPFTLLLLAGGMICKELKTPSWVSLLVGFFIGFAYMTVWSCLEGD